MTDNEARRLCIIVSKVDNHCAECMAALIPDLRSAFPDHCWELEVGWPRIVSRPNLCGVNPVQKRIAKTVSAQRSAAAKARWAAWREKKRLTLAPVNV